MTALKLVATFIAGMLAATVAMVTVGDRFYPPPVRHGPAQLFAVEYMEDVVRDSHSTENTLTTAGFRSVQDGVDEEASKPVGTYDGFWATVSHVDDIRAQVTGASNRYHLSYTLHYKDGSSERVRASYWTLACAQKRYTILRWKDCPVDQVRLDDVNQTTD